MRRRTTIMVASALIMLATPAPAQAKWGLNYRCGIKSTPNEHCYGTSERETEVLASIVAMDTETATVRDWDNGGFVTHEQWIAFPRQGVSGWIETGQIAGYQVDCCSAHRFYAEQTSKGYFKIFVEHPSGVGSNVYNYYALYDAARNGSWQILWGCPPNSTYWCEVAHYGGGWPAYLTYQEAGIEAASEYRPTSSGRDQVWASNNIRGEWTHWLGAVNTVFPEGICLAVNREHPAVGNTEFNANC